MDFVIVGLIVLIGFILLLSYKKKEYHENRKEPEEGGIDVDNSSEGDGGNGGG